MDGKQNLIFFIGLTLIIMVFWVNGYWTILKNGIAPNSSSSSTTGTGITVPFVLTSKQTKSNG